MLQAEGFVDVVEGRLKMEVCQGPAVFGSSFFVRGLSLCVFASCCLVSRVIRQGL